MQTGHAIVAVCCAIGALALLAAACLTNGHQPPMTPLEGAPTADRYCPDELRVRAAFLHPDGTAHCGGCGCLLDPAGD